MKRKIAILLAAVMTTAMLPMNVMAASTNNINKTATVKDDEIIEGVYLKILPRDEIATGDSIILTLENAKFDNDDYNKKANEDHDTSNKDYIVSYKQGAHDWDGANNALNSGKTLMTVINECFQDGSNELPYKITVNSKKEIQVSLFPIMANATDRDWTNAKGVNVGKPCYMIPLQVISDGTGDVKVKIDDNNTSVTGGQTHTFATSTSSSGSTTATVDDIETFEDWGYLEDITIKETVKDTFDSGEKVTLRLNSGFLFNESESRSSKNGKEKFAIKGGSNLTIKGPNGVLTDATFDEDEITFIMPEFTSRSKAGSIVISGLAIEADDEDEDWGDVNLTISGAGLSKQTIKVAERADYGFKMTALEEPTTIVAGRTVAYKDPDVGSDDIDDDDCVSAQIKFEETIKNTWITSRKLEFSVPEGVKITDYEFEDDEYINSNLNSYASITNDGTTLKIDKGIDIDDEDLSLFKLKLYLSADADYEGEVKLSVAGAGLSEGTLSDVVIANVITPITIEANETKTNMGYQAVDTSDIVITENQAGILIKNEKVEVKIDSAYGTDELGFADNDIDYEIDGDLKIKNFKVSKGIISFTIDKESYNEPASITIKNVQVGTTRSVPYGSYDVTVGGTAVINNYYDDDDLNDTAGIGEKASGAFDTTETYKYASYLTITTNTGTLDEVVKVTKDQKTILINDESKDMDVAPYIQSTTNSMMVPLRFVSLALGVDTNGVDDADNSSKVSWDANSKTATIFYAAGNGQKLIQFTAGSSTMVVDGTSIPMANGAVAEIRDGRMFVPFRALGQALGVPVSWDQDTFTAIYNQK